MKLRWAALTVVLALSALMPCRADAQSGAQPPGPRRNGSLGQNYPNPFNPDTKIPFFVGDSTSCNGGQTRHRVTMRIYNLLAQVVAVPQLYDGSGAAGEQNMTNVELACGWHTAYWNGKYLDTRREAASGVYLYRLEVDGQPQAVKRMFYAK